MTRSAPLRSVLVAGGGITGWCAAAALRHHAPFLDVTIVAGAPPPRSLADHVACTLPSLMGFLGDLGIGEADGVLRTGSGYRLGTLFSGWAQGRPDYVHAYGPYGRAFGPTSFHLHWVRAARNGAVPPFDAFSPAAALARAGRFAPATGEAKGVFAGHEYGLTLDPSRYGNMMRAFALHRGVRELTGEVVEGRPDGRGGIATAMLADGRALAADLFVDATGPDALLRKTLPGIRDDWARWLPGDRVIFAERAGGGEPPPVLTPVTAGAAGWHWSAGAQNGYVYASAHASDARAERTLRNAAGAAPGPPIVVNPGTLRDPWRGNCVAVGDASTECEPLEWCNLHLALSAIDRLVAMLPGREIESIDALDFNQQSLAEAERVRDFLAMHYRTARRKEPMWRDLATVEPPSSLAHTLAMFAERGRLPFYEEETFARDSWAAVLLGQGVLPRRSDPLVSALPRNEADKAMASLTAGIAAALPHVPTHAAWLAAQKGRLAR